MLGWGTFMLRKAAGSEAHIVVVSPDSPEMVAKNANRGERFWIDWIGPSTYLTEEKFVDFDAIDWLEIGIMQASGALHGLHWPWFGSMTALSPFQSD